MKKESRVNQHVPNMPENAIQHEDMVLVPRAVSAMFDVYFI